MTGCVLRGGHVFDGSGSERRADTAVAINGDRIAWVGNEDDLPGEFSGNDVEVLSISGCTILPGLIDAHVHLSYGEATAEEEIDIYTPVEYRALRAGYFARKVLQAGCTTICDPASTTNVAVAVRDAVHAGLIEGPRILAAGRQMTTPQGISDFYPDSVGVPATSVGVLTSTHDEIVREVRHQIKNGVDLIKIAGDGDAWNPINPVNMPAFTFEELQTIVDLAHRLDRKVAIHARGRQTVIDAARAGVDWIKHASFMDDEGLDAVLENDIPLMPSLTMPVNTVEFAAHEVPAFLIDLYKQEIEAACEAMSKAREAGARFMCGTDSGFKVTPYGEWHHREMELYVRDLGFNPVEALVAATRTNAEILGLDEAVGTIEAGKLADLVVVNGDPVSDIGLLQDKARIRHVFQAGRSIDLTPPRTREVLGFERAYVMWQDDYTRDAVSQRRQRVAAE